MRNINGQLAKQWKELDTQKSASVQTKTPIKYKDFCERISQLLAAFSKDIYGTANDQRYRNIVDLIIERATTIVEESYADLIDESLDDIKTDIQNILDAKYKDSLTSSDELFQELLDEIETLISNLISSYKNNIKTQITELFDSYYEKIESTTSQHIEDIDNTTEAIEDHLDQKEQEAPEKSETVKDSKQDTELNELRQSFNSYISDIFDGTNGIIAKLSQLNLTYSNTKLFSEQLDVHISNILNVFSQITYSTTVQPISNLEKINDSLSKLQKTNKQKKQDKQFAEDVISNKLVLKFINKILSNIQNLIFEAIQPVLDRTVLLFAKFLAKVLVLVVVPFCALILKPLLIFIIDPILAFLAPLIKKTLEIIGSIIDFVKDVIVDVIGPLIQFVLETIGPLLKIFLDSVVDGLILILNTIAPQIAKFMETQIELVCTIFKTLKNFIDGLGSKMKELGASTADLILLIASKLIKVFEGFASHIYEIGVKISQFIIQVFEIIHQFLLGIGNNAEKLGEEIGNFCEIVIPLFLNMFQGIEDRTEQLGKDIANLLFQFKLFLADIMTALTSIADKIGKIIGSIVNFFKGIGSQAEKIGELQGLYMVEEQEIKRIMLEQMAAKAQFIGKYLATKAVQQFSTIQNYITQIRDLCGDDVSQDVSNEFNLMLSAAEQLKQLKDKLYDLIPYKLEWEYGDYIDGGFGSGGIIKHMNERLSQTNDIRTILWKAMDKNGGYNNDMFFHSLDLTKWIADFITQQHLESRIDNILKIVNQGIAKLRTLNSDYEHIRGLEDKDRKLELSDTSIQSPNLKQINLEAQLEKNNQKAQTIDEAKEQEQSSITSKIQKIFELFSNANHEDQANGFRKKLEDSYNAITESIFDQINVPVYNNPININYSNLAIIENGNNRGEIYG